MACLMSHGPVVLTSDHEARLNNECRAELRLDVLHFTAPEKADSFWLHGSLGTQLNKHITGDTAGNFMNGTIEALSSIYILFQDPLTYIFTLRTFQRRPATSPTVNKVRPPSHWE